MEELGKLVTAKSKSRKSRKAPDSVEKKSFVLETEGYKETFDSFDKAKNQLEILKKRAIKSQLPTKVKIFEKTKDKNILVDELVIKPGFYND